MWYVYLSDIFIVKILNRIKTLHSAFENDKGEMKEKPTHF